MEDQTEQSFNMLLSSILSDIFKLHAAETAQAGILAKNLSKNDARLAQSLIDTIQIHYDFRDKKGHKQYE